MTVRAATRLAENSVPVLEAVVASLRASGVDAIVDDPGSPALLYACGLLTMELIDAGEPLEIVAAPVPANEEEPVYRSVVIAHVDVECPSIAAAASRRVAVNEYESWSGWHAFIHAAGAVPTDRVVSGSHIESIRTVVERRADVAAIDSTVWQWATAGGAPIGELRVVGETPSWPAPPLSVSTDLAADERARLVASLLAVPGVAPASAADYAPMLEFARR